MKILSRQNDSFFRLFNAASHLGAAALLGSVAVSPLPIAAQVVYSNSFPQTAFEMPQSFEIPGGANGVPFDPNFGTPVGGGIPGGGFPMNGADFSGGISGGISGEIPWNGDINSVPLLEQPQPNKPRELPPLQVPRTDAEFDARFSALKKRFSNPPLSIQRSTPARALRYSLIAGADETFLAPDVATALQNGADGATGSAANDSAAGLKPIYALGALCWNVPCAGRQLFRVADGRPIPAVGFGFQSQRGEFLATLAFAKIDRNYEIRAEEKHFTVQDLIDWEKRACSTDANLSFVAVGLAHYSQNADETWTNAFGEEWSLMKILDLETKRPVDWASTESTDKLLALTFLLARLKQGQYRDAPQIKRTEEFLVALKSRIWEIFNGAPLGDSLFFDAQTKTATPFMRLYVNGALLRWLTLTASAEEIRSEKMKRAAAELCALVDQLFNSVDDLDKLSPIDEESLSVAMQALSTYESRASR